MKSKLREDDIEAVKELGNLMGAFFALATERVGHQNIFRSCAVCRNWQEKPGAPIGCRVHRVIPPVKVIITGCDNFEDTKMTSKEMDAEIPF